MYRLRVYNKTFHPQFFIGWGWRGFVVRVLNWLRWKLEVVVQRQVLKLFSQDIPSQERRTRLAEFEFDVKAEELEKERTSPELSIPDRSVRYAPGSFQTALDSAVSDAKELPNRPKPINDLAAKYGIGARTRRYAGGKQFRTADPEGDFEPLEDSSGRDRGGSSSSN